MTWTLVADIAGGVALLAGSALAFIAALGAVRFPDLLSRMHVATKPQTLGLLMLMLGLSLTLRSMEIMWTLVLIVALQMITAPISAHMLGRAGYRTGQVSREHLVVDELSQDLRTSNGAAGDRNASDGSGGDGSSG